MSYVCPSSVTSESLFTTAGHVVNDLRNQLLPNNAEMLIFVAKNRKYLAKVCSINIFLAICIIPSV